MSAPFIIRNDNAIIGWVFAGVWFSFLAIFSLLYVRDGGFHQFDPRVELLIIFGFWLFGVAGLGPLALARRTRLTVARGGGELVSIGLWRVRRERFTRAELEAVQIRHDTDSDGDDSYSLILTPPARETIALRVSADRAQIEDLHARLLAAL